MHRRESSDRHRVNSCFAATRQVIIGFDDSLVAQTSRPPLSSIKQDVVKLGETAAELLMAKLKGDAPDSVILPVELVNRLSA